MRLHVFGDSHSAYCFDRFQGAEISWLGPKTMHRAAREVAEIVPALIETPHDDDVIVLIFGEIDIRCHLVPIAERSGLTIDVEAEALARRYIQSLKALKERMQGMRVVIVQPPFPCDRRPNSELPFRGSLEQRIEAHKALSKHLQAEADDILFLPMPQRYASKNGSLRRKFSDDGVHIMPVEAAPIAAELAKLLGARIKFNHAPVDIVRRRWNHLFGGSLKRRGLPKTTQMEIVSR